MAASGADKTEKATPKKRADARKKGQAARSSELPQSIALIVSAVMLPMALPELMQRLGDVWAATFAPDAVRDADAVAATFGVLVWETVRVLLPLVVVVTATSVAAQLALVGGKPNPHKLKPQWKALNPKQGIQRIVGPQALFDLGKTIGKLGLVVLVAWSLWDEALDNLLLGPTPMAQSLPALLSVLENLFVRIAVLGIFIGVIDAAWNRHRHDKSMKMTKQEVREEQKQQESSPLVKGEIRRRQQALSRNRMIHAVATADVVVTNPTHLAVALAYDADDPAPRVVAKGADDHRRTHPSRGPTPRRTHPRRQTRRPDAVQERRGRQPGPGRALRSHRRDPRCHLPGAVVASPARLRLPRAGILRLVWSHSVSRTHVAGWCRRAAQQRRWAETARGCGNPLSGCVAVSGEARAPTCVQAGLPGPARGVAWPARLRLPRAGILRLVWSHSVSRTHVAGWCRRAAQQRRWAETAEGVRKPFVGVRRRLGWGGSADVCPGRCGPGRGVHSSACCSRWPVGRRRGNE